MESPHIIDPTAALTEAELANAEREILAFQRMGAGWNFVKARIEVLIARKKFELLRKRPHSCPADLEDQMRLVGEIDTLQMILEPLMGQKKHLENCRAAIHDKREAEAKDRARANGTKAPAPWGPDPSNMPN